MVQMYTVFGKQIGSHYLAMAVLGTTFGGVYAATRGSGSKKSTQTPPINASSPDEENFIKNFLEQAEKDTKAAK